MTKPDHPNYERNQQIKRLYRDGQSFTEIGIEMGITRCAVAGVIKREGAKLSFSNWKARNDKGVFKRSMNKGQPTK